MNKLWVGNLLVVVEDGAGQDVCRLSCCPLLIKHTHVNPRDEHHQ